MNLTRIRRSTWLDSMVRYYVQYKPHIRYGDQDLINIYFYYHTGEHNACLHDNYVCYKCHLILIVSYIYYRHIKSFV